MVPSTAATLARIIAREHDACGRILGIPRALFAPAAADRRLRCEHMGHALESPLGVAAGPQTQLAQNLVASYLVGARFIELKTVQIRDRLEVSKPCIDMRDLGYNCEWSQELTLDQSFDQYATAFVLVHALARARGADPSGFGFNMSVGYDLAGVRSPAVRRFIERMRGAGDEIAARADAVRAAFAGTSLALAALEVPARISNDVTLSTMHGCPPAEIERIGRHLVEELGLHTTIKLNPTLLGPARLRHLLHERLGHTGVEVPDAAFAHDPSFADACAIVEALARAALKAGVRFAVKLTNTLATRNAGEVLPAKEALQYLSGRALHPLAAALAAALAERFAGAIPISLSGGADAFNTAELLACGVRPVTVSSDLLRPGGYGRLAQYLEELRARWEATGAAPLEEIRLDPARLAAYAERAADDPRYSRRGARPVFSSRRPLALVDCMAAPCREGCPAHQAVPDYLRLVAEGRADAALEVILRDNPLPATTGCACDRPCALECVRNLLDDPIDIRGIKRWAEARAESGEGAPLRKGAPSIGVVGAGPAGLAAAVFCRRMGCAVTVYEASDRAGGIPAAAIPRFRLPDEAVARDVERVERLGVTFLFGRTLGADLEIEALRAAHDAVFVATGAGAGRRLGIPGDDAPGVYDAIDFLARVKSGAPPEIGRRVAVIGGGNSALDAARAARRAVGADGSVTIVYRRTRTEMPAARDEVEAAEAEGVAIAERLAPLRAIRGAGGRVEAIECAVTEPGAPDASGRRRPVPVPGATRRVPATAVIAAVGQQRGRGVPRADAALAAGEGGVVTGGDALRGPSMIVQAVADARAFARSVADRFGLADEAAPAPAPPIDVNEQLARRSRRIFARTDAREEAARCLGCDALCALCVTVCPNRANVLYEVVPAPGGPAQRFQTANVADWCNACGNCEAFCPTGGAPYRDKPRICLSDAAEREIADGAVFRFAPGGWEMSEKRGGEAVRIVRSGDPAPGDAEGARLRAIGAALAGGLGYLAVVAR